MTKEDYYNGVLKVGDFVRLSAGVPKNRKLTWQVIMLNLPNCKIWVDGLVALKLVDGWWTEHGNNYAPGYVRIVHYNIIQKLNKV